jgi:hypothetical protein
MIEIRSIENRSMIKPKHFWFLSNSFNNLGINNFKTEKKLWNKNFFLINLINKIIVQNPNPMPNAT